MIKWLWAFVPAPAKIWVLLGLIAAGGAAVGFVVYKIDERGYNRCQAAYTVAAAEHKEKARGEIIDSGKKYDELKKTIVRQVGPNDPVGPRVSTAIDSMP